MPRYDYKCPKCGHIEEIVHPIKECDLTFKCEKCYTIMQRIIEAPHLEGSNVFPFYFRNCRYDKKKHPKGILINNRSELRKLCDEKKLYHPYLHVGG